MASESDSKPRYPETLPDITFKEKTCIKKAWRHVVVVLMSLILGIGIGYFLGYVLHKDPADHTSHQYPQAQHARRSPPSVFSPLTYEEIKSVVDYCEQTNITNNKRAVSIFHRNKIISLSVFIPSKDAVLAYLDNNGGYPGRHARVYVDKAMEDPPYFVEYQIGPLHQAPMAHKVLRTVTDYDRRPRSTVEFSKISAIATAELEKLNELFEECFDGGTVSIKERGEKQLRVSVSSLSSEVGRISTVFMLIPGKLSTSDILPVFATISHAGLDLTKWKLFDIYFFRQGPFATTDDLLAAYKIGNLTLFKLPKGYINSIKTSRDYTRHKHQPLREKAYLRPPKTIEPDGPRYTVTDYLVEWMGWSMELSMNNYHGPAIFDIRYKGERLVYENSLSDLSLLYSSLNPGAGLTLTILSDMIFRLGTFTNIIRGLDCPEYATILNVTTFSESRQKPFIREAICIFEADGQRPLWRHSGYINSGMNHNYLNIRIPLSLGNYDYTFDFEFHLDGKMWTYVTASGSLFTAFWFKDDDTVGSEKSRTQFGYRVAEHSIGSIHDHLFSFKVDIDVVSRNNTFEKIHWRGGTISEAVKSQTNKPADIYMYGTPFNYTRYLEFEKIREEKGLVIDSKPVVWSVINENLRNKWGNFRGVRIEHTQEYQEVLPQDHPAFVAFPQMKYNLAISKHHDGEEFVDTVQYDKQRLNDPLQNLHHFLDDENIENSDLVTWVSVRFLHLPTNEDFPMTTGAPRGFLIQPMNFFHDTPTFDMPQYDIYKNGTIKNNPYFIHKQHSILPEDIDRPDYA